MINYETKEASKFERNAKNAKRQLELQLEELRQEEESNSLYVYDEINDLNQRLRFIDYLIKQYKYQSALESPEIFISFTGKEGDSIMKELSSKINKLSVPQLGKTFKVKNGMIIEGRMRVLDHIVEKIKSCCIFVGILTNDFKLHKEKSENHRYSPGSWVLIEAGIAIGLNLPVILFVEEGIERSIWTNFTGYKKHTKFQRNKKIGIVEDKNMHHAMSNLCKLIQENYKEYYLT